MKKRREKFVIKFDKRWEKFVIKFEKKAEKVIYKFSHTFSALSAYWTVIHTFLGFGHFLSLLDTFSYFLSLLDIF
jgi:hypothetical protein